jgi:hypothetical protein
VNPHNFLKAFSAGMLICLASALAAQQNAAKSGFAAAAHARPHELEGFLLRRDRRAFEASLGKPFHEQDGPNSTKVCAYHLPNSKKNYLVVFFFVSTKKDSQLNGKAVQLELTGPEPSGPTGFFGLQLRDSATQVEMVLGRPASIRHEQEEDLDLWNYERDNYTLDFTPDHRLYSIQVIEQERKGDPELAGRDEVRLFAQTIQTRNWDAVLEMASGEIECSTSEAFGIRTGPARSILTDPQSAVSRCLKHATDAILTEKPGMKGADDALRLWDSMRMGMVTKFPASSPLREVVFVDEAGALRVYEVTFR